MAWYSRLDYCGNHANLDKDIMRRAATAGHKLWRASFPIQRIAEVQGCAPTHFSDPIYPLISKRLWILIWRGQMLFRERSSILLTFPVQSWQPPFLPWLAFVCLVFRVGLWSTRSSTLDRFFPIAPVFPLLSSLFAIPDHIGVFHLQQNCWTMSVHRNTMDSTIQIKSPSNSKGSQ